MNSENPFAPPNNAQETRLNESAVRDESLGAIAKQVCLDWEKLRLIYIAVLGAETIAIGFLAHPLILTPEFWGGALLGAVFANVCFFIGPVIETYISWLGYPSRALRFVMFIAGTLFSCLLVIISLRSLVVQMSN